MVRNEALSVSIEVCGGYSESVFHDQVKMRDGDEMTHTLTALLTRLRSDHDLDLAAVTSDGVVAAVDSTPGLDTEAVCNTVGDLVLLNAALGAEMDRGSTRMSLIEYERGAVVITPLKTGEDLVLLSTDTTNLGRVRIAARRFQEAYKGDEVRA